MRSHEPQAQRAEAAPAAAPGRARGPAPLDNRALDNRALGNRVLSRLAAAGMAVPDLAAGGNAAAARFVQRCGPVPCDCDDKEREEYYRLHRHADGPAPVAGPPPSFLNTMAESGSGQALPAEFRADAEAKFGTGLGHVRLHTDAPAAQAAEQVGALAFTVDNDIYFGAGQYKPETEAGQRLLAHELTHVVQDGAPVPATASKWVSHPNDPAERAAEAAADAFMADRPVRVAGHAGHGVARDGNAPPAAEKPVDRVVRLIRELGDREAMLKACLAAGAQWDQVEQAWQATKDPRSLLDAVKNFSQGAGDAARVYAYLRFGSLRLADKLFIAGIGAGTDEETIYRLLPAIRTSLGETATAFADSYSKNGGTAYGAEYTTDATLPDGQSNKIAGFLDDELSGGDQIKANALLAYGELRPVDEVEIALRATHIGQGDIMAALDKVHHSAPDGQKPQAEAQYNQSYHRELRPLLSAELGEAGRNFARARMILDGDFTPVNRIRIACEAWVVDTAQIFEALGDATAAQLAELKKDWDANGEVRKLVEGKWTISGAEGKRIRTFITNGGTGMEARLALAGVETTDTQGVIQAALKNPETRQAFAAEYPKKAEFYQAFTGNGTIGAATLWGDKLVSPDWHVRLKLAVELRSEEGVKDVLTTMVTTDAARAEVRADEPTMAVLKDMSGWSAIEPLTAPREDLQARSVWLGQRFEREKGMWGDTASAAAYGDEKRQLDAELAKAVDPAHLTPAERARIQPLVAGAESALNDFIQVRDQLDAIAIQVVGTIAGLLATALTGGAAGPVTASLLARVALAQACANVAAVWVVKGERTTGGEATRAFAVGAVTGASQLLASGPVMGVLSAEYKAALATESAQVAAAVAEREFTGTGLGAMKAAGEGLVSNSVGSAVDTASRSETWRKGFIDGLAQTFEKAAEGGLTGAVTGAAAELFSAAVRAAVAGRVAEANHLLGQLETQVPPEQAAAARSAVAAELQDTLGHPAGTAKATEQQAPLLAESGGYADAGSLPAEHLTAEKDLVKRSQPQPSSVEGYVDEVDLGNGHVWRRKPDGTWCRFSTPSGCGTVIDAPPMSAEALARVKRTPEELVARALARMEQNKLTREEALHLLGLTMDELNAMAARAHTDNELAALLQERAKAMGVDVRAEAQQAGRPHGPEADENVTEMNTKSAEDIQAEALANKPLPDATERKMLQAAVDDVSTRLLHSPEEAAQWLSEGERKAVNENPVHLTAMYFGNAVERAVAHDLETIPALKRFLPTKQRPGVATPDIQLPIGPNGARAADIFANSPGGHAAHAKRSYAPFTQFVTYPSLPSGWRFPVL